MAYVSYISRQHLDVNGVPLDGGKIFAYISGTTDHLDTFVDKECTRLHTWPIVLDSRGNCEVYVADNTPARYELYNSSGEHVETWDAIPIDDADLSGYAKKEELAAHVNDRDNPHHVTAAQVGAYTKGEVDDKLREMSKKHLDMKVDSDVVEFFMMET